MSENYPKAGNNNITFWLVGCCIFFIPLSFELNIFQATMIQFPLEVLVGISALYALFFLITNPYKIQHTFTDYGVAIFMLTAIITSPWSLYPMISYKAVTALCAYASAFYILPRYAGFDKRQWQKLWDLLTISFFILMTYTFVQYSQLGIHRQMSYKMSLPFVSGHSLLIAIGFPAFLRSAVQLYQKKRVAVNIVFSLAFLILVAISFSRVYWVIIIISGFIMTYYYIKKIRLPLVVTSLALTIIGFSVYTYIDNKRDRERAWDDPDDHNSVFIQIQSIFVWHKNESNRERTNRWMVGRDIFKDHPLTGCGLNTYPEVYFKYKDTTPIEETNLSCIKMNIHQTYLGWLTEMGVPGLISGILLFVGFLIAVIKSRGSPFFLFNALLLLNFFLLGIIEDYTTIEKIIAVYWISMAFTVHSGLEQTSEENLR